MVQELEELKIIRNQIRIGICDSTRRVPPRGAADIYIFLSCIEYAMRRDTAAPNSSKCHFEECFCLRLTVLWEMQIQALCVEGIVCVPGSLLVLGGSSRFSVVLRVSGRFFAVLRIGRLGAITF